MDHKKRICKCSPKLQKAYKKVKIRDVNDIKDIVESLAYQAECSKQDNKTKLPVFKTRPFKYRHSRVPCVPMTPSMHTRLRYIGHCDIKPHKVPASRSRQPYMGIDSDSFSDEETSGTKKRRTSAKKNVRYLDLTPGDVILAPPVYSIKHTCDEAEMFNVPSPKTSGEVIQAQKVVFKSGDFKPPLPPKSIHELYKPHSGIVVNKDNDFVADVVHVPGPRRIPEPSGRIRKLRPCYKGGPCRKRYPKKICPQYGAKSKRNVKYKPGRLPSDVSCGIPYGSRNFGAADGKPRVRGRQKNIIYDDSICGLDEIPKPEHAHIPKNLKRGTLRTHSLTILPCRKEQKPDTHYGILTGSFNMYDARFGGKSRGRQALAISVMAYSLAFHYHPKQWTMKLVDNVVQAGDIWYQKLSSEVHDHTEIQGMCEVLPFGKKQTLNLNGKRMKILLGEPDIIGYTMSKDPTVYNLCRALKVFFKNNRGGVFLSRVLKVVIWRDKVCYYVFDPAGRDSRAYSNFVNGFAALMNVKDYKSVADILLARTILNDQKFVLAPVKVLKMVDEKLDEDLESDREVTQAEKATMGYRIITENCALVNANMHLGDKCFDDAAYRQAIPIAVVTMTYAKISPPNTWYSKTIDKILRLGNKLYVDCVQPKILIDMTIDNIPNEIIIGPYACEIIIYRERIKGQLFSTKECILNIRSGLEEFFNQGYNSGIIEFNNYALATWRQREMFYLFDPYPRTSDGLRTFDAGRACCFMQLNSDSMAEVFTKNWDYLPPTTQFYIHAFKVLKLKKREPKMQIRCTLSDEHFHGSKKVKRRILHASRGKGDDSQEYLGQVLPMNDHERPTGAQIDEEKLGDIVSLIDSINEDYLPPIPLRYKNMEAEPFKERIVNLDSPSVSVTQVVPPWPKPRDKTNEPPEPDPDPEPTPPPTPPPISAEDAEEEVEEEEDEEAKAEAARRKAEEEEALRKASELPPALPPPPPSPQSELEVPLAQPIQIIEDEVQTMEMEPVNVERQILLNEDARYRSNLRKLRKKITPPLTEDQFELSAEEELAKPSNFKKLLDNSQIIRGTAAITDDSATDILPFVAIMAIVTSYKYIVNTWTVGLVNFVVETGKKLYENKRERFQLAPVHIIPRITIGHQTYHANIDVVAEGATWQLEDIISQKFLYKYDRGMLTTPTYSCAFFKRNGLYYLYDGTPCNPMGLRDDGNKKGKACFLRFQTLHDLVARVAYNKDGKTEDQQFVLSRIIVRKLLIEPRLKLPDDYDFTTGFPKSKKSRFSIADSKTSDMKKSSIDKAEPKSQTVIGYQQVNGTYRIEGTTALKDKKSSSDVKSCHFVCLIAMLMATMHPIRTWDHVMVDTCIEKGLEIYEKAAVLRACEKRVVKNIILDGKIINLNIKKVIVINENPEKRLDQILRAVLNRLRYVIIRFPSCSMVICYIDGYYHLFDPYASTVENSDPNLEPQESASKSKTSITKSIISFVKKDEHMAGWDLNRSIDSLIRRIKKCVSEPNSPEFYTFELTSAKLAPRHAALNYRLSPLFKPDENPNVLFLKPRRIRPTVDEKMYWLNIEAVPWSRTKPTNDLGIPRGISKSMWKDWDIEFSGDLYSLWGTIHPMDPKFEEGNRGNQILAISVVALVMTTACNLSAWTSSLLDGIVKIGDIYYKKCAGKFGKNHEISLSDLDTKFDDMYPYSFSVKFDKIIFGFVYNIYPDRFNLSKALVYFFEKSNLGILTSPAKNLGFGKAGASYFMFDCQSYGAPIFSPGQGASYILKCESLNRLVYCMTLTLNVRRHEQQFHLFGITVTLNEKSK